MSAHADEARHPLPRRPRGPRRQGRQLRRTCATRATRSSWPRSTTRRAPTSSSSSTSPRRHEERPTMLDVATRTAEECFIPYTVGGGMRSADGHPRDARGRRRQDLAELGGGARPRAHHAHRAHLRRAVHRRGHRRAARRRAAATAGRSSSTAAASTPSSTRSSGSREAERLGAGEILLTSMDRDGTKDGYDIPLTRAVTRGGQHPGHRERRRGRARALRRGRHRGRRRRGARRERRSTSASSRCARSRSTWRPTASRCGCRSCADVPHEGKLRFMPRLADTSAWDTRYRTSGALWGYFPAVSAEETWWRLRETGARRVLVVGCGYGRHVAYFARRGFDTTGLDVSRAAIDMALRGCQ